MEEQLQSFHLSHTSAGNHHKRILLYTVGVVLLLLVGGGAGYMLGIKSNTPLKQSI